MSLRIVTVVGARPQFVKVAAVSRAIQRWNEQHSADPIVDTLVHTGQHFDDNMSGVFFRQLGIPEPAYNLGIAGSSHGAMTGRMLEAIEKVLDEVRPDWVLVYGDTNSTLAAALAAIKLHLPVAHVEAGLRSFNLRMPEEVNRIVADSVSTLLFCPTETAVDNLHREGYRQGVHNVGDVMLDASLHMRAIAERESVILEKLDLRPGEYVLATCHRAENTDDPARLRAILDALAAVNRQLPVVLPLHPRTRKLASQHGLEATLAELRVTEPLSYLDITRLESAAAVLATDSGGMQKEAFFYRVPCVTLRDETEWVETVSSGWNRLASPSGDGIGDAIRAALGSRPTASPQAYGTGQAAEMILSWLRRTPATLPSRCATTDETS